MPTVLDIPDPLRSRLRNRAARKPSSLQELILRSPVTTRCCVGKELALLILHSRASSLRLDTKIFEVVFFPEIVPQQFGEL